MASIRRQHGSIHSRILLYIVPTHPAAQRVPTSIVSQSVKYSIIYAFGARRDILMVHMRASQCSRCVEITAVRGFDFLNQWAVGFDVADSGVHDGLRACTCRTATVELVRATRLLVLHLTDDGGALKRRYCAKVSIPMRTKSPENIIVRINDKCTKHSQTVTSAYSCCVLYILYSTRRTLCDFNIHAYINKNSVRNFKMYI